MAIAISIIIGISVLLAGCGWAFGNLKTWSAINTMRVSLRARPPEPRRRAWRTTLVMCGVIAGYDLLLFVHPLGLKDTFVWFLIVPFLVLAPLGTLVIGIRAVRGPDRSPPPRDH